MLKILAVLKLGVEVLAISMLGNAMVLVMGSTMVVVMALDDVGVGQNIVEVKVEGQLSSTEVAVWRK